jgi:deoxyadenosine/deoxycytidine kinase
MSLQHLSSISIDGNLCAGKSWFCAKLRAVKNASIKIKVIDEPLNAFQRIILEDGSQWNPLREYYMSPRQNAMAFQLWVLHCLDNSYHKVVEDLQTNPVDMLVFDRCLDSTKVFLDVLKARRYVTDMEYHITKKEIEKVHKKYFGDQPFSCDRICFIDTPIAECISRLPIRGRLAETSFDGNMENYQYFLEHFYAEHLWFFGLLQGPASVLKLDLSDDSLDPINKIFEFANELLGRN